MVLEGLSREALNGKNPYWWPWGASLLLHGAFWLMLYAMPTRSPEVSLPVLKLELIPHIQKIDSVTTESEKSLVPLPQKAPSPPSRSSLTPARPSMALPDKKNPLKRTSKPELKPLKPPPALSKSAEVMTKNEPTASSSPTLSPEQPKKNSLEHSKEAFALALPLHEENATALHEMAETHVENTFANQETFSTSEKTNDNSGAPGEALKQLEGLLNQYLQTIEVTRYYPPQALRQGWEGKIKVQLILDERGEIQEARIAQKSDFVLLDRAALRVIEDHKSALRRYLEAQGWRLTSTAQRYTLILPIEFRLPP